MSTIQDYFIQSQLALAAYANLQPGTPNPAELVKDNVGMSANQADRFAFEIIGNAVLRPFKAAGTF